MKHGLIAAGALVALASAANAQVAFWNFNVGASSGTVASFPIGTALSSGAPGSMTLGGPSVSTNNLFFTGTTVDGSDLGTGAGNDLASQWGTSGANAGAYWQFEFDATGASSMSLDLAFRSTGSGPASADVYASGDLGTLLSGSPIGTITITRDSVYRVSSPIALPALLDGDSSAYFAIVPRWDAGNHTTSGNMRIDNVRVVPTPGAAALLGLAGVAGLRRRAR